MRVQLTVFPEVTKEQTAVVEAASSQQVLLVAISLAKPTLNSDVQNTWLLIQVEVLDRTGLRVAGSTPWLNSTNSHAPSGGFTSSTS